MQASARIHAGLSQKRKAAASAKEGQSPCKGAPAAGVPHSGGGMGADGSPSSELDEGPVPWSLKGDDGATALLVRHKYLRPIPTVQPIVSAGKDAAPAEVADLLRDGEAAVKPPAGMPPAVKPTASYPEWRPPTVGPSPPAAPRNPASRGRGARSRSQAPEVMAPSSSPPKVAASAIGGSPKVRAPTATSKEKPPMPPPAMVTELPELHHGRADRPRRALGMYRLARRQPPRPQGGKTAVALAPLHYGQAATEQAAKQGPLPSREGATEDFLRLSILDQNEAGCDAWREQMVRSALHFARVCDAPPGMLMKCGAFGLG